MTPRRFVRAMAWQQLGVVMFGEVMGDQLLIVEAPEGVKVQPYMVPMTDVLLDAPIKPSKVVAVALNYRAHAEEMKKPIPEEPLFFMKPTTAIIGPGGTIRLPPASSEVHFEGELGIVIGRELSRATPEQAREAIAGLTCVNDVTARDIQRKQNHYTRSKGYDTFCPVGPYIATGLDPTDLGIQTRVNGEVRQNSRTTDMIFGPYELLSFISHIMTLLPGDLVSTGTPPGVGPLKVGDFVEVEVEGVGILANKVMGAQ